jgi:hypothetical protein
MNLRAWQRLFSELAPTWTRPESVRVRHDWGEGVRFEGQGLFSSHVSGMELFGSSEVGIPGSVSIAHWELLERILTWEARERFARPNRSFQFRHSTSNGVAVHTDLEQARKSARLELLERDRILCSWYGYIRPQLLGTPTSAELRAPAEYAWWEAQLPVPTGDRSRIEVALTLGIPKDPKRPVTLGFGAGDYLAEALQKSRREARQRLGFLWGSRLPRCPDLRRSEPTPLLHQDYYSLRQNQDLLLRWLYEGNAPALRSVPALPGKVAFQTLTPSQAEGALHLIRAHASTTIPLTFGYWNALRPSLRRKPQGLHPLA